MTKNLSDIGFDVGDREEWGDLRQYLSTPNIINWEGTTDDALSSLYTKVDGTNNRSIKEIFLLSFLSSFLLSQSSLPHLIIKWIKENNPFEEIIDINSIANFNWISLPVLIVPEDETPAEIKYFLIGHALSSSTEIELLPNWAEQKLFDDSTMAIKESIRLALNLNSTEEHAKVIVIPMIHSESVPIEGKSLGLPFALGTYFLQKEINPWPTGIYATGEVTQRKDDKNAIIKKVGYVDKKYRLCGKKSNFKLFLFPEKTDHIQQQQIYSSQGGGQATSVATLQRAISEVKSFIHGQILPDVNNDPRVAPVSKVKCVYPRSIDRPDMPYEVGSILGLDRGNYIALINAPLVNIHSSLIHSERNLHEALKVTPIEYRKEINLPVRWWVRLEFSSYPPSDEEDIAQFFKFKNDTFLGLVKDNIWLDKTTNRNQIIPGILFSISDATQNTEECIKNWCLRLREIYKNYPLAIVVSFELGEKSHPLMEKTHNILSEKNKYDISCPVVCLHEFSTRNRNADIKCKEEKITNDNDIFDWLPSEEINVPWSNLLALIKKLPRKVRSELNEHKNLVLLCSLLKKTDLQNNKHQEINYEVLVNDLRNEIPETINKELFTHELLQITKKHSPPLDLKKFILELAQCRDEDIRKATLSFIFQNPTCQDWWIEGTGLATDVFPDTGFLFQLLPPPQRPPLVERLALALMRYINLTDDTLKQENARSILQEYLPDLVGLSKAFAEQIISGNKELPTNGYSDNVLQLALKIFFPIRPNDFLTNFNFDSTTNSYWWYVFAGNLNDDIICKLVSLPLAQRATIGLIDPFDELPRALTDPHDKVTILNRRRGLPIFCTQQYPKNKRKKND